MDVTVTHNYLACDLEMVISLLRGVAPYALTAEMVLDMTKSDTDAVWRVEELRDGRVETTYIGFYPIDYDRVIYYEDSSKLPEWINDRVAVLRMMPCNPTTSIVFGVGRRISESVFWVVEGDN